MDPKKYDTFMVDSVVFYLSDQSDYKGIDPQETKELAVKFIDHARGVKREPAK